MAHQLMQNTDVGKLGCGLSILLVLQS